jgi:hypothetical protein
MADWEGAAGSLEVDQEAADYIETLGERFGFVG